MVGLLLPRSIELAVATWVRPTLCPRRVRTSEPWLSSRER